MCVCVSQQLGLECRVMQDSEVKPVHLSAKSGQVSFSTHMRDVQQLKSIHTSVLRVPHEIASVRLSVHQTEAIHGLGAPRSLGPAMSLTFALIRSTLLKPFLQESRRACQCETRPRREGDHTATLSLCRGEAAEQRGGAVALLSASSRTP